MINNIVTNDDDNEVAIHTSPVSNGSSTITQDQYEKPVHLLQNSTINQGIIPIISNQLGSSSFIGHPPSNGKGKTFSFTYKGCSLKSWIIGSGASDHICSSSSWFLSYIEIQPINVRLPNGQYALAKHVDTVKFSHDFIISNVLYIPNFSVNL